MGRSERILFGSARPCYAGALKEHGRPFWAGLTTPASILACIGTGAKPGVLVLSSTSIVTAKTRSIARVVGR